MRDVTNGGMRTANLGDLRERLLASRLQLTASIFSSKRRAEILSDSALAELEDLDGQDTNTGGIAQDAPALPKFAIGDVINGRYEVLRILGAGGMGVVYGVLDRMFQKRPTALKTMQRLSEGEWLDLFRAEFRMLADLQHPNVARVYEFALLHGGAGHFFTMEYVDGKELSSALEGASPERIWSCLCEMAEALSYLHGHEVLHLDVKPANAVLNTEGTCKLLDFGLVGMAKKPGHLCGSPRYMAPELFCEAPSSPRSDLYALGLSGLELFLGQPPFAQLATAADVFSERGQGSLGYTPEQVQNVPEAMRACLLKLCAPEPNDRYPSAAVFLEAATKLQGSQGRKLTVSRSSFVGREQERAAIMSFVKARLGGLAETASLATIGAPSGMGKSRLLAEIRHDLQAEGHVFLQGTAYDHDVGEFTALTPILLASAQLAISMGRRDVVDKFLPELVKMTPEFGHLYGANPSLPYTHGEAERERISRAARDYLLSVSAVTPYVMHLDDLQWAADGTINALKFLVDALQEDTSPRLALLLSFRSDQISGRPIEGWLTSFASEHVRHVPLAPLLPAQVEHMLASMLGMPVSPGIAGKMHEATHGMPFYIEETLRWLENEGVLRVESGQVVAGKDLDWHVEVDQRIVARARQQSALGQDLLKLLAVCARPIALEHLCAAAEQGEEHAVEELHRLTKDQLVTYVAGDSPMYSLDHDRIRESLFAAMTMEERVACHARLGQGFLQSVRVRPRDDVTVFAAVHLNETPLPQAEKERLERCDLNLNAAESAQRAGDFEQALVFLSAAESALQPKLWQQHDRAMRLTLQRAGTLRTLLRFEQSIAACDQGLAYARNLLEEG